MTQRDRVLELLADGRWHSTIEFVECGILRAAARIHELRRRGVAIESQSTRSRGRAPAYAYRRIRAEGDVVRLAHEALAELDQDDAAQDAAAVEPESEQLALDGLAA